MWNTVEASLWSLDASMKTRSHGCEIKDLEDPGTLYFGLTVDSDRTSETLQEIGIPRRIL